MSDGWRIAYGFLGGIYGASAGLNVYWSITRPSALCAGLAGFAAGGVLYYIGRAVRGTP